MCHVALENLQINIAYLKQNSLQIVSVVVPLAPRDRSATPIQTYVLLDFLSTVLFLFFKFVFRFPVDL